MEEACRRVSLVVGVNRNNSKARVDSVFYPLNDAFQAHLYRKPGEQHFHR